MGQMTQLNIPHAKNEKLVISKEVTHPEVTFPRFTAVSQKFVPSHDYSSLDFIEFLGTLNKTEMRVFILLYKKRNPFTNVAELATTELEENFRARFSTGYQSLNRMGVVKRIKQGVYLISPDTVFHPVSYEEVKKRWESLP